MQQLRWLWALKSVPQKPANQYVHVFAVEVCGKLVVKDVHLRMHLAHQCDMHANRLYVYVSTQSKNADARMHRGLLIVRCAAQQEPLVLDFPEPQLPKSSRHMTALASMLTLHLEPLAETPTSTVTPPPSPIIGRSPMFMTMPCGSRSASEKLPPLRTLASFANLRQH
jgi:hypothetical protein